MIHIYIIINLIISIVYIIQDIMTYIKLNQRQFATCTYTFSWGLLRETPFQLVQKISKKKDEIISKPILRRSTPKRYQPPEEVSITDVNDVMFEMDEDIMNFF
jgi:hypothetical protein